MIHPKHLLNTFVKCYNIMKDNSHILKKWAVLSGEGGDSALDNTLA